MVVPQLPILKGYERYPQVEIVSPSFRANTCNTFLTKNHRLGFLYVNISPRHPCSSGCDFCPSITVKTHVFTVKNSRNKTLIASQRCFLFFSTIFLLEMWLGESMGGSFSKEASWKAKVSLVSQTIHGTGIFTQILASFYWTCGFLGTKHSWIVWRNIILRLPPSHGNIDVRTISWRVNLPLFPLTYPPQK